MRRGRTVIRGLSVGDVHNPRSSPPDIGDSSAAALDAIGAHESTIHSLERNQLKTSAIEVELSSAIQLSAIGVVVYARRKHEPEDESEIFHADIQQVPIGWVT